MTKAIPDWGRPSMPESCPCPRASPTPALPRATLPSPLSSGLGEVVASHAGLLAPDVRGCGGELAGGVGQANGT